MAEEDQRVGRIQAMSLQDRPAVSLLAVEESVLRNTHVAVHMVEERDRQLSDRMESDETPAARKRFQRGETAVAGPEQVDQLAGADAGGAVVGSTADRRLLCVLQLFE